jgi:hypothetical protein
MPDTIPANETHGIKGFYRRVACRAAQVSQALLALLFL